MAEMLIQSESLTAIADKIRVLSGTEGNMSLEAMENHVDNANTDVATEADLIAQITSALEGKAAGGGSGSANIPSATTAKFGREPIYEQAPEGKIYFNGVLLPEIPATGFESTPYLMVLPHSSGSIFLYGSTSKPYYTLRSSSKSLELPSGRNRCVYDSENDVWGELQSSTSSTWCNLSENWNIIWSNFDIPNGSASATDVYFKGTESTIEIAIGYGDYVSDSKNYAVTSDSLNELAHDIQLYSGTHNTVSGSEIRDYLGSLLDSLINEEYYKRNHYNVFWDELQSKGTRTNYAMAFAYCWNDSMFFPKYDLTITNGSSMFHSADITNLKRRLDELGIKFNTSQNTSFLQMFQSSDVTHVPELDMRLSTNSNYCFSGADKLETIENIIIAETTAIGSTTFNAPGLKNIRFEGTIGASIAFSSTYLTKESIVSTVNALSDNKTGLTATFKKGAVNTAFETSTGAADGSTSTEWNALINTKPNWAFSLS